MSSLSCPVCLSVTSVSCDKTVEWMKMPLGTEVGLIPGHIVLDGNPATPRKGAQQPPPRILAHVYTCSQYHRVTEHSNRHKCGLHCYKKRSVCILASDSRCSCTARCDTEKGPCVMKCIRRLTFLTRPDFSPVSRFKAKFHYAIWSQTGSKLVADLQRAEIWPII